jgi:hypothetical protein
MINRARTVGDPGTFSGRHFKEEKRKGRQYYHHHHEQCGIM